MQENTLQQPQISGQTTSMRWIVLGIIVIILLSVSGLVLYQILSNRQMAQNAALAAQQKAQGEAAAALIADKVGVQITKIVVTADGGLVDLRYQVIDPDKAVYFFSDLTLVPKIYTADGAEIALTAVPHRHDLQSGIQYFIIYRNAGGAVKPGNPVTVSIGKDIRLENFMVEP